MNIIKTSNLTKANINHKYSHLLKGIQYKSKSKPLFLTKLHFFSIFFKLSVNTNDYFFKKQEYDRAYKFLSEEMKDTKSCLVYSRKFPNFPMKITKLQISRYVFFNSILYLLYTNGIYNFMFVWFLGNLMFWTKKILLAYKNSKKISSIFLIKTQNDFTNEIEFYFIVGYGFRKKVQVINLINLHSYTRSKMEKELFVLDDNKITNLGFNIQFTYCKKEILIFNRDIFKFFFKQEKQLEILRIVNQKREGTVALF
jgi:hypothetical protein